MPTPHTTPIQHWTMTFGDQHQPRCWAFVTIFPAPGLICLRPVHGNTPTSHSSWFTITSTRTALPREEEQLSPWEPRQASHTLLALNLVKWVFIDDVPRASPALIARGRRPGQAMPMVFKMVLQRTPTPLPRFTRLQLRTSSAGFQRQRRELCLALSMANHPRLGMGSPARHLSPDLCALLLHDLLFPTSAPRTALSMPDSFYTGQPVNHFAPHEAWPLPPPGL
jgi:hypothetical protein